MKKLAIVTSHPIQYNAPWFRLLAERGAVTPRVFYTWEQSNSGGQYDPEFRKKIAWDIPLLEGYDYRWVRNISKDPGTHHFKGLINPDLNKEIMEWGPDAILVFGWSFHSHLRCLRFFHGKIPVLFRGDSTLLDERPGIKRQLRRLFLKWVYRHVDKALYVGKNNKEYFLKHGLREDQLLLAPHAVDNRRFCEPDAEYGKEAALLRSSLDIGPTDLVLLYAGKLYPIKNPFFLLEIAKRVSDPRLKIVFVGNGILEGELKQAASQDARIRFIEFQNQSKMPVVYRVGDIFVLPSHSETWGLGANEAMASGCALMLSNKVGGAIDLIAEGRNGVMLGTEDWDKGSDLVTRLLRDRAELTKMKNASRDVVRNFSYEHIVEAIEQFMKN